MTTITLHRLEHVSGNGPYAASTWPEVDWSVRTNSFVGCQATACHRDPRYLESVPDMIHAAAWYTPNWGSNPWAYACPTATLLCEWVGVPRPQHQPDWRYVVVEADPENVILSPHGEQALYRVDRYHVRHELTLLELRHAYEEECRDS